MNEKILKELVSTRNVLKRKLQSLRADETSTREQLSDTFKPITEPLREYIKNSKNSNINNDIQTKIESNKSLQLKKNPSIKLETSTPKKLEEKSLNESDNDDDDDDEFFSQSETLENTNIEDISASLSILKERNALDTNYGPHKDFNNEWKFGDSSIKLNDGKINVGAQSWALTPGLFALMFQKIPKDYDKSELEIYKKILISTNAHKRDYNHDGQIKGTRAYKYKNIIKKLFKEPNGKDLLKSVENKTRDKYLGDGLMRFNPHKTNYIYWDDPNELVDRLRLLVASQAAGHTNHNNEIVSIIEELREANIIE